MTGRVPWLVGWLGEAYGLGRSHPSVRGGRSGVLGVSAEIAAAAVICGGAVSGAQAAKPPSWVRVATPRTAVWPGVLRGLWGPSFLICPWGY